MRLEQYLISEGIHDKGIFKAVFMAGSPGAGKTYTLSKVRVGEVEPRIVNTDKWFAFYKEQWMKDWASISDKVKTLSKNQLALYLNSMLPLVVDTTSTNPGALIRRNGLIESIGYDTIMMFVNTSLETSLERNKQREREVNEDFLRKAYEKANELKPFYRSKFSSFIEINNDVGELNNKVILDTFKRLSSFYNSPIQNPIGTKRKERMLENGWKYLSPNIMTMDEIKKVVSVWYRK